MKKILFDLSVCQPFGHIKFHGGGVYGSIVFKRLCEVEPNRIIAYYDKTRFISQDILEVIYKFSIEQVDASSVRLIDAIRKDVSLFYSPLQSKEYESIYNCNIPIFITIHGLRKLEMNRDEYESLYSSTLFDYCKARLKQSFFYSVLFNNVYLSNKQLIDQPNVNIITVSNHSKSSINYFYPSTLTKDVSVYYSPSTADNDFRKTLPYSTEKYYLIISADRWLKNAYRALLAFDSIFKRMPNHIGKVIVVGLSSNNRLFGKIKNRERFIVLDYVAKETLESLMRGAYALVYPTLNEGFGYPPLEAMKFGTPVISSPFASLTEVFSDSVLYANPYSYEEIAMRILQLEDPNVYDDYCAKSLRRYEFISNRQIEDLDKLVNKLLSFTK